MKKIRSLVIGGVAAVAGILATTACTTAPAEPADRTLVIASGSEFPANWNPLQGAYHFPTSLSSGAVYEGLLDWNYGDDTWEPNLAREVTFSDDRRSFEIVLRDDVEFVDGQHMTAAGVKTYLDALLSSDYVLNGSLLPYDPRIEVTGEYSLEVTVSKPIYVGDFGRAFFYSSVILSPGVLDDPEAAAAGPIGSGPYLVDEFDPTTEVTFVRNPDYWNPDAYPYDTIVVKVLADPVARLNALKSGQIDAAEITIAQAKEALGSGLTVEEIGGTYDGLVVQNPAASPSEPLRDARVRQAMMYAFDRESIAQTLYGGYARSTVQPFGSADPAYVEGAEERYPYDPDRARELLAEAGYPDGFDVTIPGNGNHLEPVVQQSLADIGIRVTYEQMGPDWVSAAYGGRYALVLYPSMTSYNTLRDLTEEFPGLGRAIVPTPEIEELVATIMTGSDEEVLEGSRELGEFLLEEAWIIPIAEPLRLWASIPSVDIRPGFNTAPALRDFVPAD